MKTLVTGGSGFIGSHLVDALLTAGHTVAVVDDLSRGTYHQATPGVALTKMSVTDPGFDEVLAAFAPDVVFHLAAQIDVRHSMEDPAGDVTANVLGTVNVVRSCVRHQVKTVVFSSSGGTVYGETEIIPTPEEHPNAPLSTYGVSKRACELYGAMLTRGSTTTFTSLRYGNVYGPRQDPHGEAGVVAIFIGAMLQGRQAVIHGDGLQTRDYVYVDDVVAANLAAMDRSLPGEFNIGTQIETSVLGIYEEVAAACRVTTPPVHDEAKKGEQMRSCLFIDEGRLALGWEPSLRLQEGISRTVAFFRTQEAAGVAAR